jgi:hypothetical protein
MTQQLDAGVVRPMHLVVRRRADTSAGRCGDTHREAGWTGAADRPRCSPQRWRLGPSAGGGSAGWISVCSWTPGPDVGAREPGLESSTAGAHHDEVTYFPTPLYQFRKLLAGLASSDIELPSPV